MQQRKSIAARRRNRRAGAGGPAAGRDAGPRSRWRCRRGRRPGTRSSGACHGPKSIAFGLLRARGFPRDGAGTARALDEAVALANLDRLAQGPPLAARCSSARPGSSSARRRRAMPRLWSVTPRAISRSDVRHASACSKRATDSCSGPAAVPRLERAVAKLCWARACQPLSESAAKCASATPNALRARGDRRRGRGCRRRRRRCGRSGRAPRRRRKERRQQLPEVVGERARRVRVAALAQLFLGAEPVAVRPDRVGAERVRKWRRRGSRSVKAQRASKSPGCGPADLRNVLVRGFSLPDSWLIPAAGTRCEEALDRGPSRTHALHPRAKPRLVALSAAGLLQVGPDPGSAVGKRFAQTVFEDGKHFGRKAEQREESAAGAGLAGPGKDRCDVAVVESRDHGRDEKTPVRMPARSESRAIVSNRWGHRGSRWAPWPGPRRRRRKGTLT